MTFISLEFAFFFAVVVLIYFLLPHKFRWLLLLIASYIFCATWNVGFAAVLAVSTLGNFLSGRAIYKSEDRKRRYLFIGVAFNLLLLFVFKYFNFFTDSLTALLNVFHISPLLTILLPIGISYYTFQELSYLLDIYHGKLAAENNLGIFAAFVAFFPQLTAGPIGRATSLLPQFRQHMEFKSDRVVEGLRLILWGIFKKIVVADHLAVFVNQIYGHPQGNSGSVLLVTTFFLAFQIYCDFSGYSDIAIGIARILGFKLMDNFRQPYFSQSFQEFWQRWHISLSTWIRDYIFFPLSRTFLRQTHGRFARLIQIVAYLIIMALVGLWHGASLPFLVWGLLHGAFLGLEGLFRRRQPTQGRLRAVAGIIITFVGVSWAWIFFRANTLADAWYITTHIFLVTLHPQRELIAAFGPDVIGQILVMGLLIAFIVGVDALDRGWGFNNLLGRMPAWGRWAIYYALMAGILWLGFWGRPDFLYFQF